MGDSQVLERVSLGWRSLGAPGRRELNLKDIDAQAAFDHVKRKAHLRSRLNRLAR